jgi:hypothetical protein|nr:MAG TPA: hypothetical protein [Caudoviricetes sp.]
MLKDSKESLQRLKGDSIIILIPEMKIFLDCKQNLMVFEKKLKGHLEVRGIGQNELR